MVNRRFIGLMAAVLLLVAGTGVYYENSAAQRAAEGTGITKTVTTSICCALTPGPTTTVFSQVTENVPTTTTLTATTTAFSTTTATSVICCQTVTTTQNGGPGGTTTVTVTSTTTVTTTPATLGPLTMIASLLTPSVPVNQGSTFAVSIQVSNTGSQSASFTISPYVQSTTGGSASDITFSPNFLNNVVLAQATTPMQLGVSVAQAAASGASYNLAFSLQAPGVTGGSLVQNIQITLGQSGNGGGVVNQGWSQQNGAQTGTCTVKVNTAGGLVVDMVASTSSSTTYSSHDSFGDSFSQLGYQTGGFMSFYALAQGSGQDTIAIGLSSSGNIYSQCYDVPKGHTTGVSLASGSGSSTLAQATSSLSITSQSAVLSIVRANNVGVSPTYSAPSPFTLSAAGTVFNGFSNYDASAYAVVSSSTSCPVQLSVTDGWDMMCIAIPLY